MAEPERWLAIEICDQHYTRIHKAYRSPVA
jgi:hypothetical protein